mmetsp:Transcript_13832/g.16475  ORF Transcript_13832/g.16475 Transcript_13832/m.16475 type:complete len:181 (+) Transcript_13832:57-599(+)
MDHYQHSSPEVSNYFLTVCSVLSRVTQFAGCLSSIMNVFMVFTFSAMPTPELILRCYGVIFGFFIVLVELEFSIILSHAAFTDSWVARGLCIAFVGLLDVLFDHQDNDFDGYRHAVGFLVIAVGVVYTSLGLLCFKQLKTAAVAKSKRQKLMKEEVHHLTAQKIEIERLLADTESKLQSL